MLGGSRRYTISVRQWSSHMQIMPNTTANMSHVQLWFYADKKFGGGRNLGHMEGYKGMIISIMSGYCNCNADNNVKTNVH